MFKNGLAYSAGYTPAALTQTEQAHVYSVRTETVRHEREISNAGR